MKTLAKKILRLIGSPFILRDFWRFQGMRDDRFEMRFSDIYPCIKDKTVKTGFDRHYVYFTAWATRKLQEYKPEKHVDFSSSLYFSGIVSAFLPIEFYDFRPADLELSNLKSLQADLTDLKLADNSLDSISCMHVLEHIGLGRYGDTLDPKGDIKAAKELSRVLTKGGRLLFVVPVGSESKIEYNAHRIYSYESVLFLFPDLQLKEFTLIPEKSGAPVIEANPALLKDENYACGCFEFIKL